MRKLITTLALATTCVTTVAVSHTPTPQHHFGVTASRSWTPTPQHHLGVTA